MDLSPLVLAGVSGAAAIVLRVPGGDVIALVVGMGAIMLQAVALSVRPAGD